MKNKNDWFKISRIRSLFFIPALIIIGCKSAAFTSAKLYMAQNDYPKAREFLEKEVTDNPNNAEAYYLLGYIHAQKERFVAMDSAFNASLKISDDYEYEINQIRSFYWIDKFNAGINKIQTNKIKEAIEDFKTAIDKTFRKPPGYPILVCGSFFLLEEAYRWWKQNHSGQTARRRSR